MVASKHLTPLPPFEHETSEPTVWIVEEPLATIPIAAATGISASSNSSRAVESPHGPFATLEVLERLGALSSSYAPASILSAFATSLASVVLTPLIATATTLFSISVPIAISIAISISIAITIARA
mmetsp:Transcript_14073/g.21051  ORF Transcript_14073/g.21051 Transcript_14073/m.21051 type:complete len:126 (-) Transcript_14073:223-600(-)